MWRGHNRVIMRDLRFLSSSDGNVNLLQADEPPQWPQVFNTSTLTGWINILMLLKYFIFIEVKQLFDAGEPRLLLHTSRLPFKSQLLD